MKAVVIYLAIVLMATLVAAAPADEPTTTSTASPTSQASDNKGQQLWAELSPEQRDCIRDQEPKL